MKLNYRLGIELWVVLVPASNRAGDSFTKDHHKAWDARVAAISGGLTVLPPAKGYWVNAEEAIRESVIPVQIACTRAQLGEVIALTMEHYDQDSVMAYKASSEAVVAYRTG